MRRICAIACACLIACACIAGERWVEFSVKTGTNATTAVTDTERCIGRVEEIYFPVPTVSNGTAVTIGLVTNAVTVVATPQINTNLASTTLYSNSTLTNSIVARPRVTQQDSTGAALGSLSVAERFLCAGDAVKLSVTQSSGQTGLTVKAYLKLSE